MKRFSVILFLFSIILCAKSFGQKRYVELDQKYMHTESDLSVNEREIERLKKRAIDVTSFLPDGYVKNGSADYSDIIQSVITANDIIILPNFPVLINENGLRLRSNSAIIFQSHSKLIIRPNNKTHYSLLKIVDVENITIHNANLVGDRFKHKGNSGQWGMGILIQGAKDIKIVNPVISEFWGDGLYIGPYKSKPSKNIEIENAFLDNNRRNGISVTSVSGLNIIKPIIANSNGQAPMAGIDIEPNSNYDEINNIEIISPITFHNTVYGIAFSLNKLVGATPKEVNITIKDHINVGSKYGLRLPALRIKPGQSNISGTIRISNSNFFSPQKYAIKPITFYESNIYLNIKGVNVIRRSKHGKVFEDKSWVKKIKDNLISFDKIKFNESGI